MQNLSTIKPTTGESPFDRIRLTTTDGSERWSARDLMPLMGYSTWQKFETPLNRAMATAENQGHDVESNFNRSSKITATKPQQDYQLSRYAAYLVAMNGDPNKPEVAAAQNYFAVKTREAETQPATALPQNYLEALKQLVATVEENQALTATVEEQKPLVAQAQTYNAGDNLTSRREFAREIVAYAHNLGLKIRHSDVYAYLGRRLNLFVFAETSEAGQAKTDAVRAGYAVTTKGTARNGHNFATGKLTARGKEYAWRRCVRDLELYGYLPLTAGEVAV